MKTKRLVFLWTIFKQSFRLFGKHDTLTLGAALSYYTVFSIAPVLIIVISVAGAILGPQAVQGEVSSQLQSLLGAQSATQLEDIIKAAYEPGKNWFATGIAIVLLIVGATTVFGQLRLSLNTIWNVKEKAKKPVLKFFLNRLFSFGMIACLAFLLLVSLIIHASLSAFSDYLNSRLPNISTLLLKTVDILLSYGLTSVLFAVIYKYMSDAKLRWNSILPGACFTAVLFALGKYLIGLYLGKSHIATTYGAAGSVVLVLAWVFYSSQILFFGAEFTRALATERGVSLDSVAVKPTEEAPAHTEKNKS